MRWAGLAGRDRIELVRIKLTVARVLIHKETACLHRFMQAVRSLLGRSRTSELLHERFPQSMIGRIL